MSNTNCVIAERMQGACIISEKDTETLEWIHGTSINRFEVNVKLSLCDVGYLIEHLFLNIFNLMFGNPLACAWPDPDGEEQLQNWRLINILIKSGEITKDDVKVQFDNIFGCNTDDDEVLNLFDRYIV